MPLISIGLPVYNGENYLEQSLKSILNQTFEDFELIISDNASTDATQQICLDYAASDRRIRYYRQEKNLGCARNSNFVFEEAKGRLFKWASHDDLHAPTFVERCVEALRQEPSTVLACPRAILIDGAGREIIPVEKGGRYYWLDDSGQQYRIRPYDPPRRLNSPQPYQRFWDVLLKTHWITEIYGLMRADVLRKTSLHGGYLGTDKRIIAELSLLGPFVEIPEVLFYYRQHPAQWKRYRAQGPARDQYLSGEGGTWCKIPRSQNLRGYLRAPMRTDLSAAQRCLCWLGVAAWLCRVRQWPGLLAETYYNLTAAAATPKVHREQPARTM